MTVLEVATQLGMVADNTHGAEHTFLCDQHDDTNPSLRINDDKNEWVCYGCNVGGGVAQFIRHYAAERVHEFQLEPTLRPPADAGVTEAAERAFVCFSQRASRSPHCEAIDRAAMLLDDVAVLALTRSHSA